MKNCLFEVRAVFLRGKLRKRVSQIIDFCQQVKFRVANSGDFEEMLEYEENICICYRFYTNRCFIFLVLCFSLTSELNYPSPECFRGAALFSEYAELLDV